MSDEPARPSPFLRWLFQGLTEGAHHAHPTYPWWKVMCLTGVDYFSTLGYQPGIASLAAGAALARSRPSSSCCSRSSARCRSTAGSRADSPHGQGCISMLERAAAALEGQGSSSSCLLGFVATDFVITITLSAADATRPHRREPVRAARASSHQVGVTLVLLAAAGRGLPRGSRRPSASPSSSSALYLRSTSSCSVRASARSSRTRRCFRDWQRRAARRSTATRSR